MMKGKFASQEEIREFATGLFDLLQTLWTWSSTRRFMLDWNPIWKPGINVHHSSLPTFGALDKHFQTTSLHLISLGFRYWRTWVLTSALVSQLKDSSNISLPYSRLAVSNYFIFVDYFGKNVLHIADIINFWSLRWSCRSASVLCSPYCSWNPMNI